MVTEDINYYIMMNEEKIKKITLIEKKTKKLEYNVNMTIHL